MALNQVPTKRSDKKPRVKKKSTFSVLQRDDTVAATDSAIHYI
jgi:hypothetical protein